MTQAHLGRRPPPNIPLSEEINNPCIDGITRLEPDKSNALLLCLTLHLSIWENT